jgi:hypothetical protein
MQASVREGQGVMKIMRGHFAVGWIQRLLIEALGGKQRGRVQDASGDRSSLRQKSKCTTRSHEANC